MRLNALLLFFLFIATKGIAQEEENLKLITKKGTTFDEEYFVLADNKKIKHGRYTKYRVLNKGIELIETGNYKDNLKDGEWLYFGDENETIFKISGSCSIPNSSIINFFMNNKEITNTISVKGSYVYGKKNGIWTTFHPDTISNIDLRYSLDKKGKKDAAQIEINQNEGKPQSIGMYRNDKRVGLWLFYNSKGTLIQKANFSTHELFYDISLKDSTTYNSNREPVYMGTKHNLEKSFNKELLKVLLPNGLAAKNDSAIVSFVVDMNGGIMDEPQTESSTYSKTQNNEFSQFIKRTNGNWLPGLSNGVAVPKTYKLHILTQSIPTKEGDRVTSVKYKIDVTALSQ